MMSADARSGPDRSSAGVVSDKNIYYRDGFRNLMRIVNVQAGLILLLVLFLAFHIMSAENQDRFFAQTAEGRTMKMSGLYFPNMGRMARMAWVSQAATQVMTFGFNDIDKKFQESRRRFTPEGWESFRKAVIKSGLVDSVIASQQIVSAIPQELPVLSQEGLINGKYSWVFDMRLLITFRAGGVQRTLPKRLRMVVERVPTYDHPEGIGIGEWYMY